MPPVLKGWTLDKHFPLAVFVGFIAQTAVIAAWGTNKYDSIDSRVTALEKSDDDQSTHEKRITILEQKFDFISDSLAEIKLLLRRQVPDPNQQ